MTLYSRMLITPMLIIISIRLIHVVLVMAPAVHIHPPHTRQWRERARLSIKKHSSPRWLILDTVWWYVCWEWNRSWLSWLWGRYTLWVDTAGGVVAPLNPAHGGWQGYIMSHRIQLIIFRGWSVESSRLKYTTVVHVGPMFCQYMFP